jgi:hypothetical protein
MVTSLVLFRFKINYGYLRVICISIRASGLSEVFDLPIKVSLFFTILSKVSFTEFSDVLPVFFSLSSLHYTK